MDRIVTGYSLFVASTPAFWVAMMLLMVFAVKLHWFPIGFSVPIGMDAGQISIAVNGVLTRNYTRETLQSALEALLLPEENANGEKRTSRIPSIRRGRKS